VLAGGVLTGKYDRDPTTGRAAGSLDDPLVARTAATARNLAALARELDATPSALAIAFALANPLVASVLFGSTTPEQVRQNAEALVVAARLGEEELTRLRAVG